MPMPMPMPMPRPLWSLAFEFLGCELELVFVFVFVFVWVFELDLVVWKLELNCDALPIGVMTGGKNDPTLEGDRKNESSSSSPPSAVLRYPPVVSWRMSIAEVVPVAEPTNSASASTMLANTSWMVWKDGRASARRSQQAEIKRARLSSACLVVVVVTIPVPIEVEVVVKYNAQNAQNAHQLYSMDRLTRQECW